MLMAMEENLSWWPLPAWISPGAALFVFFNVLVGAIAVTSREQPGGRPVSRRRLCRSASSMVLDRLRSFSMFPVYHAAGCSYESSQEEDEQQVMRESAPAAEPPSAPAEALAVDAAASMSETRKDEVEEANVPDHAPGLLLRPARAATAADEASAAVERPASKKPRNDVAAKHSKRRGRASCREAEETEGKAELNARAEMFIRQFREDLRLQRLNSIINYTRGLAPEHN